ncbi:uncharacterized protein ko isoform X1 [Cherax quadricarinatus]|uniref:uncharacterized protein ko isoform X1 n=1 Tax=Cherax quadricarinatus TaxID=27406 RepID=UPI00387EC31C
MIKRRGPGAGAPPLQAQMGENVVLYQRCLAIKLTRDHPPPTRPSSAFEEVGGRKVPSTTSTTPSTDSDTPTPTNGPPLGSLTTTTPVVSDLTTSVHSAISTTTTNHQDGYLLFLAWQTANLVCVWDKELLVAVQETEYVGHLVGGVVLVGGSSCVLAALTHAWSRALLAAPTGFTITMFGEVSGCSVVTVPQGQFTPLGDALCWVIHRLTRDGGRAEAEAVRATLAITFPSLVAPDAAHIHSTLSNLIRQCKVFYTGHSYGIVQPNTYLLTAVPDKSPGNSHTLSPTGSSSHPFPGVINKPHLCGTNAMCSDNLSHAAAQTDLAELITGSSQPADKLITPSPIPPGFWSGGSSTLERQTSLRVLSSHRSHSRTASLRLSPNKAALLATAFANEPSSSLHSNIYKAHDMSDITVRAGERGSVLSKLLRVSPRRRLGSFSAQFPPPEWSDNDAPAVHLHCVAVQTVSQHKQQEEKEFWWCGASQWTPRSATLPRRLRRPQSATPPLSQRSDSSSPAPQQTSYFHIQGSHFLSHVHLQMSPSHCSHTPAKEKDERLGAEVSPMHRCGEPVFITRSHRHRSPAYQHYENHEHWSPVHPNAGNHKHRSPVHSNTETYKHHSPVCQSIENYKYRPPAHHYSENKKTHNECSFESSPNKRTLHNQVPIKKQIHEEFPHHSLLESHTVTTKAQTHKRQTELHQKKSREEIKVPLQETCTNVSRDVQIKKLSEVLIKRSGEGVERTQDENMQRSEEMPVSQRHRHRPHHSIKEDENIQRSEEMPLTQNHRHRPHHNMKEKNQKQEESNLKNQSTEKYQRRDKDREDSKDEIVSNADKKSQTNNVKSHKNIPFENKEERSQKMLELKEGEKEPQIEISKAGKKPECKEAKRNENCQRQKLKRDLPRKNVLQYDRSSLQLDLASTNMNNSRKVVSSPQRPEGLKNNMLHNDNGLTDISKGSCHDLTSRNLGYQEVDKCHKQMCSQTLDQVQQQTVSPTQQTQISPYTKKQCLCSPKKKISPETEAQNDTNIVVLDNKQATSKDVSSTSTTCMEKDGDKVSSSPDAEVVSVSTYPSLPELNLNFSSLAAQKILCGASINSIDTLVEVNLAAEKHNINNKHSESVTNTDFGFL